MNLAEQETTQAEPEAAELALSEVPPAGETNAASDAQPDAGEGDEPGELVVSIGEEAPPQTEEQSAPGWVRDLRKQNRELTKRLKELEAKDKQPAQSAPPPKPTFESCDWDEGKFADAVVEWNTAKRQADEVQANQQKLVDQAQEAWNAKVAAYSERKQALPAEVNDAESTVIDALVAQWGPEVGELRWKLIVDGADDPAMLMLALGKYPEKVKELAKIESLARFTMQAGKMEAAMKVTKRTATVAPEKPMTGTAAVGVGGADATLERLRKEADKTGDRSAVVNYIRKQKLAQRNR